MSPNERTGIDRLIARVDAERIVARTHMETYLGGIQAQSVAEETVRRFGDVAAAPWMTNEGNEG